MLCDQCQQFCVGVLTGVVDQGEWGPCSQGFRLRRDIVFTDMERSRKFALYGQCCLCSLIYDCYQTFERNWVSGKIGPPIHQFPPQNRLTVSIIVPASTPKFGYRPWRFHFVEPYRWFEFCFLDSQDTCRRHLQAEITQLDVAIAPCVEPHIGTEIEGYSGSDSIYDLAIRWISDCQSNHAGCRERSHKKRLPRRLVDVGELINNDSWSQPRIIQPEDKFGYYVALSYRWSAVANQFCTTPENLSDLMRSLPLWQLPKTVREAVGLCRKLGYQYLWVDSLCIVQGDDDDWNEACHGMASIFENSHLTISALQSEDSHAGLFHHRKYKDLSSLIRLRLRDGRLLTLRPTNFNCELRFDIHSSPMTNRGWILQEKLLSPANIHFGRNGLHWECRSSTVSEAFANAEFPADSVLKNILSEIQRPGCSVYSGGHFIVWYMIMMEYSRKSLTFETDRLPAILGLAQRFRKMFSTTFVAGLWLEDLHRGLLWNVGPSSRKYTNPEQPQSSQSSPLDPPPPREVYRKDCVSS